MSLPKSIEEIDFSSIEINAKPSAGPQFTIIYGKGGTGKSSIACYSPDPVIVPIGRETGHERMMVPKLERPQGMDTIPHVFACIAKLLKSEHSRKTVIFDNLWSYREAVEDDVIESNPDCDSKGKKAQALSDYGYGKGQAMAYPYYTRLAAGFDALMKKKGMHVILLAHDASYNINLADGTYYTKLSINAPGGENTNVRGFFEARAHNVFYLRAEDSTLNVKGAMGQTRKIASNRGIERVLYTKPTSEFFAKSRVNMAPSYVLDHSETEEELLHKRSNQSIINIFEELYK